MRDEGQVGARFRYSFLCWRFRLTITVSFGHAHVVLLEISSRSLRAPSRAMNKSVRGEKYIGGFAVHLVISRAAGLSPFPSPQLSPSLATRFYRWPWNGFCCWLGRPASRVSNHSPGVWFSTSPLIKRNKPTPKRCLKSRWRRFPILYVEPCPRKRIRS
jgi:hypothetical protein